MVLFFFLFCSEFFALKRLPNYHWTDNALKIMSWHSTINSRSFCFVYYFLIYIHSSFPQLCWCSMMEWCFLLHRYPELFIQLFYKYWSLQEKLWWWVWTLILWEFELLSVYGDDLRMTNSSICRTGWIFQPLDSRLSPSGFFSSRLTPSGMQKQGAWLHFWWWKVMQVKLFIISIPKELPSSIEHEY